MAAPLSHLLAAVLHDIMALFVRGGEMRGEGGEDDTGGGLNAFQRRNFKANNCSSISTPKFLVLK